MPELPEVQTTVDGLNKRVVGMTISTVWSDWEKTIRSHDFRTFKNRVTGREILGAERRGKNILLHLEGNKTLRIHMKMTGHLLFGRYRQSWQEGKSVWVPEDPESPLADPFNRFIHVVFTLRDKNNNVWHLAFCDVRKFGRIELHDTDKVHEQKDLAAMGPEILSGLSLEQFKAQLLKRPKGKIKQVLMNQEILAGIGNIYSDEILWASDVHPEAIVKDIPEHRFPVIYKNSKDLLAAGITLGGDSDSDYRNIDGEKGQFQGEHRAYRRKGEECEKPGCDGVIERSVVGGRSAHFCAKHQVKHPVADSGVPAEDFLVDEVAQAGVAATPSQKKISWREVIVVVITLAFVVMIAQKSNSNPETTVRVSEDPVMYSDSVNLKKVQNHLEVEFDTTNVSSFSPSFWRISSRELGSSSIIGPVVSFFVQGVVNQSESLTITKPTRLVINEGRSPVGASFRINSCSGYLSQFQNFSPALERNCKSWNRDDLVDMEGSSELSESCLTLIENIPPCLVMYDGFPEGTSLSCQEFIANNLNYNSCVDIHKSDPDFFTNEWRIYLGSEEPLFESEDDIIEIHDENGRLVKNLSY